MAGNERGGKYTPTMSAAHTCLFYEEGKGRRTRDGASEKQG
ncbi:MAG: hypothetical protein M0Z58_03925 [Nitrospiraceae bacterium]|nr:hypothetical protein [Nitrospiraceae bacterium]